MNNAVHECSSAIPVALKMNIAVHECSSAITVGVEMNTERSTHNPPGVCAVQVAARSEREMYSW